MRALIVQGYGKSISYKEGSIVVRERGRTIARYSPSEISQIIVIGNVAITSKAIRALSAYACDVLFISWRGELYARVSFPEMRTVATRRQQYMAYEDGRGTYIAKEILRSKLRNQYYYLMTLQKLSSGEAAREVEQRRAEVKGSLEKIDAVDGKLEEVRGELLGIEGEAARAYFSAISKYLPEGLFEGREGRGAQDPVNSMLNYGYAILMGAIWRAVHMAGLDPYAGYLHADRPGKPSLVLDLMEMYRTQAVDRVVVSTVKGGVPKGDWRQEIAAKVASRLSEKVPYSGMRVEMSQSAVMAARNLASFLRGERSSFEGFYLSW